MDTIADHAGGITGMACDAAARVKSVTRAATDAFGMPRLLFRYDSGTHQMSSDTYNALHRMTRIGCHSSIY